MSRFWPHTAYAEDQPLAATILYTHVATRGLQLGSVIGLGAGSSTFVLRRSGFLKPRLSSFASTILRSAGVGAVIGTGFFTAMVPLRMMGMEEIEWKDRSWRLLENKGQIECDDWTYAATAAGLASAVTSKPPSGSAWRSIAGRAGLGSLAGMMGYMGWRYGINGGKRDDEAL